MSSEPTHQELKDALLAAITALHNAARALNNNGNRALQSYGQDAANAAIAASKVYMQCL